MNSHWIVIADASRARILAKANGDADFAVVSEIDFPAARLRNQELVTDEAGRIAKGRSGVISAADPRSDPHEQQARLFSVKLGRLLDQAAEQHAYSRLTLVAPAHFLGLLKGRLSTVAYDKVAVWLPKDLTHVPLTNLAEHLEELSAKR